MSKIKPQVAQGRIESFEKRFGKAHLYLAYHAAFPLALTPDLLYRLWANFQRDISGEVLGIPWIAVADLLLSRLCDEVGHELYEMDLAVRNVLLSRFKEDEKFSQQRINELSDFMLDYIRQQLNSDDPDIRDFAQAQKWTALAYTQPRKAARELALALSTAAQNDRDDLLRLTSLVETLAEPLSEFEEFQPLLIYARGMASFVRGNQEDVEAYIKLQSAVVAGVWRDQVRQAALRMVKLWKILIVSAAIVVLAIAGVRYLQLRPLAITKSSPERYTLKDNLKGHSSDVNSVTFSPDGQMLVTGSDDRTIKLWNWATKQQIRTFKGHTSYIYAIAISPDGKTIASGSADKTIKLWNLNTGEEIRTLKGHSDSVASVAFSPDGKLLASGSLDKTIKLWNLETGQEIRTLAGHSNAVNSVAFSPDGKLLASGSWDKTIKLWNVNTGKEIRTLTGHSDSVFSIAFSPDGQQLASGSKDKTIKLWNLSTGKEIRTLTGHDDKVTSVAYIRSSDSVILASGSNDNTIKLWDITTGREIRTLKKDSGYVYAIAISPDGRTIASGGSADNIIKIWRLGEQGDGAVRAKPLR